MKTIDTCETEQLVSALRECRVALTFYAQWMKDHCPHGNGTIHYPYGVKAESTARALLSEYCVTGVSMPRGKATV